MNLSESLGNISFWMTQCSFREPARPLPTLDDREFFNFSRIQFFRGTTSVVNVENVFGGNLDFPKIKKLKYVLMSEPALKCENNDIFTQNNTPKLLLLL